MVRAGKDGCPPRSCHSELLAEPINQYQNSVMNSLLPLELQSVCFEYPLIMSVNLTSVFCISVLEVSYGYVKIVGRQMIGRGVGVELFLLCAFDYVQILFNFST